MAINRAIPHVYDAEYVGGGGAALSEISLFNRAQSNSISYTDAAAASINRTKGFEDTNMTEDGRVTECGLLVMGLGLNIFPGVNPDDELYALDVAKFFERGYAELIINESQKIFTARLRDLVPRNRLVASGAVSTTATTVTTGVMAMAVQGREFDGARCRIPRGTRFSLKVKWDRSITLPSAKTARVEAEIWARNLDPILKREAAKRPQSDSDAASNGR